jgi:hypothetical protein
MMNNLAMHFDTACSPRILRPWLSLHLAAPDIALTRLTLQIGCATAARFSSPHPLSFIIWLHAAVKGMPH